MRDDDETLSPYEQYEANRRTYIRAVALYDQASAGFNELSMKRQSQAFWGGFKLGVMSAVFVVFVLMCFDVL